MKSFSTFFLLTYICIAQKDNNSITNNIICTYLSISGIVHAKTCCTPQVPGVQD